MRFILLAFLVVSIANEVLAQSTCGNGESRTVTVGNTYKCCSTGDVDTVSYSIDGGSHTDNIKVRELPK